MKNSTHSKNFVLHLKNRFAALEALEEEDGVGAEDGLFKVNKLWDNFKEADISAGKADLGPQKRTKRKNWISEAT